MMWGWGDAWGGWLVGALMMLLFWGGIVALVVFAFRGWGGERRDGRHEERPDAREILEERFAKGEISEDEFEQRRRVLEHAAH
jgi:putative membrane protein